MEKFVIHQFKDSDLNDVIRLNKLALQKEDAFFDRKILDKDLINIKNIYLKNQGEFLVATFNKKIIGMGALQKLTKKSAMLKRMRVHPKYQRRGIGQAILDQLERKTKLMGYKIILLNTLKHQRKSQKFYEKNKYVKYRQGFEHGFNVLYYKKSLG